jgi:hypothetical protein
MRHRAVTAGALGSALLASLYWASWRGPAQVPPDRAKSGDNARVQAPSIVADAVRVTGDNTAAERAASELRAMSQSFRNSSLLIAIRRAGFYCDDVVSASESTDGVWLASCADKLGYTLSVQDVDRFDVRPVAHYFDSLTPVPVDRDSPLERREQERVR